MCESVLEVKWSCERHSERMTSDMNRPTKPDNLSWGEVLKQYRFTNNMKQMALADDLGVTQAMVSRWEADLVEPGKQMQERILKLVAPESLSAPMVGWREYIADVPAIAAVISGEGILETVSVGMVRETGLARASCEGQALTHSFSRGLPDLFLRLESIGFFDERIETVESVDKYVLCDGSRTGDTLFVHSMNWWRRGEDLKPRWVFTGARVSEQEFETLQAEFGSQIRTTPIA